MNEANFLMTLSVVRTDCVNVGEFITACHNYLGFVSDDISVGQEISLGD